MKRGFLPHGPVLSGDSRAHAGVGTAPLPPRAAAPRPPRPSLLLRPRARVSLVFSLRAHDSSPKRCSYAPAPSSPQAVTCLNTLWVCLTSAPRTLSAPRWVRVAVELSSLNLDVAAPWPQPGGPFCDPDADVEVRRGLHLPNVSRPVTTG